MQTSMIDDKSTSIQINLLPWREAARQRKKTQFIASLVACCISSFFVLMMCHLYYSSIHSSQAEINSILQNEISQGQATLNEMSSQVAESRSVILQLHTIIDLYNESFRSVRFLSELTGLVPSNISLYKIKHDGDDITLTGVAVSEAAVTEFMQQIGKSPYFNQPVLSSISMDSDKMGAQKNFQIKLVQKG